MAKRKDLHKNQKTVKKTSVKKSTQKNRQNDAKSKTVDAAKLKKTVAQLKKQNDALDDKYLRAEAEMQNVQRHAAQDQQQIMKYSGQKLAKSILPGLDNLKRAMNTKVVDKNGKQLKKGVQMSYHILTHALSENNVKEVDVLGKPFNPEVAQAVQTVPADKKHPKDQVVKVLQNGYQIHDRTLRPAMVIVAK